MRLDLRAAETAVADSMDTLASDQEEDKILIPKHFTSQIRSKQCAFCHVIESNGRLILVLIDENPTSLIKYSIVGNAELCITFHVVKTPTTRLGSNLCILSDVKSKRAVMNLLDGILKWDCAVSKKNINENKDNNIFRQFASCSQCCPGRRGGQGVYHPVPLRPVGAELKGKKAEKVLGRLHDLLVHFFHLHSSCLQI